MEIKFNSVEEALEFADRYRGASSPAGPLSADLAADLGKLAGNASKITAIKIHKGITGLGLKESKEAIDRFWPYPPNRY